jgi:hypothetical protein
MFKQINWMQFKKKNISSITREINETYSQWVDLALTPVQSDFPYRINPTGQTLLQYAVFLSLAFLLSDVSPFVALDFSI